MEGKNSMYSYTVAVCDDESYYREEIIKMFTAYQSESGNKLIVNEYSSGEELLKAIKVEKKRFQIIILDVEMDGISGVETANEIRKSDEGAGIIFVTGHETYAFDAYKVEAVGYLTKPVEYIGLKKIMAKTIIMVDFIKEKEEAEKRYLEIMTQHEKIRIEINRILYIEKRRNAALIHTSDNEYSCYETLSELYGKLDQRKFTYCHQGYIVNFHKVKDVGKNSIRFNAHLEVPLSRKYYKELRSKFLSGIQNASHS